MELNHEELKMVLKRAYETKMPVDIKGKTGIGKSEVNKQVGEEIAGNRRKFMEWNEMTIEQKRDMLNNPDKIKEIFLYVDIRMSEMCPEDMKGIPDLNAEVTEWKPNIVWKILSHPDADGIVFFDELNLAQTSIFPSLYKIINDRQIGEYPISKNILIISAGNTRDDKANVFDEPAPLKNRRINYTLKCPFMDENSPDDWGKWAINSGRVSPDIVAFLYFRPSYLHKFELNMKEDSFPTPRMWVKATKLIDNVKDKNHIKILLSGAVGEGVTREYMAFISSKDKLNIREILKNPEKAKKITELDLKYALVSGIVEIYRNDKKILNDMLAVGMNMEPEFAMFMLRWAKAYTKNNFANELIKCSNWKKVSSEFSKYLL